MIIVTPLGHVLPDFVRADASTRTRSLELFARELHETVIPFVESHYRTARDPASRALAGLSMGGAQALHVGLTAPSAFGWVAGFGAAIPSDAFDRTYASFFPDPAGPGHGLKLLWLGCGRDDRLFAANRSLHEALAARDIRHTFHESPGGHTWINWRRYLVTLLPLLFQDAEAGPENLRTE